MKESLFHLLKAHWRLSVSALFGVLVFCLWYFLWPHILMQRESETVFIWDWTFVNDLLAMPWGWFSLITAFVSQFFYHIFLGAIVMVVLCLMTQWITYRLLRFTGSSVWLFLLSFLPAIYVCSLPLYPHGENKETIVYDYLQRQGKWPKIIQLSKHKEPQTKACQNVVLLANFMTRQTDESTLFNTLKTGRMVLTSRTAAFIMSDIYMQMGMVAMSQRAAFEAMESIEDFNKSGRALQRLAVTNLVCGQYEVARKYMLLLERTLFYRLWAKKMLPLTEQPELLNSYPSLSRLRQMQNDSKDRIFH